MTSLSLIWLGLHVPPAVDPASEDWTAFDHNEDTDMCAEVWRGSDGEWYVATYHDAVGLVTWFAVHGTNSSTTPEAVLDAALNR